MQRYFYLLAAFAVLSVNGSQVINKTEEPNLNGWGDLVQGSFTQRSVLIFEARLNGTEFEWRGHNEISRFEVVNQGNNNSPLFLLNIRGGLSSDFLQLWSNTEPVNGLVRIYSEPVRRTLGWRENGDQLVNTTRITGFAPLNVEIAGAFNVNQLDFIDRTNGTGVTISDSGLYQRPIRLQLQSQLFRGRVDFDVNIYGQRVTPNHHEIGNLTKTSVLVGSELISAANLSWADQVTFNLPEHQFDYARLTDLTDGTGGSVLSSSVYEDQLEIFFRRQETLHFLLQVYGSPLNYTDIVVGELQPGSILLEEELVSHWAQQSTVVFRTEHPIDRIEVRNLDRRSKVVATLVAGEVGGQLVIVLLETDELRFFDFAIRVYGRVRGSS